MNNNYIELGNIRYGEMAKKFDPLDIAIIRSKLLGIEVHKHQNINPGMFGCHYCCFSWLCTTMGMKWEIINDVGDCESGKYVFTRDAYEDTADIELYKDIQEIIAQGYSKEEETRLIKLNVTSWLYERGFNQDTIIKHSDAPPPF